jgi:spectinomycin phosphotransferase
MRVLPQGLDEDDIVAALRHGWDIDAAHLHYAPVGGGSYHWRVADPLGLSHWVTVDDLDQKAFLGSTRDAVFDQLHRALSTACALRDVGLEFVIGPVSTVDGTVLRRIGGRYALAVYPFIEARAGVFGQPRSDVERAAAVDALVRLHRAAPAAERVRRATPATVRVATPEVPHRDALERALSELDRPWRGGPYAELARARLAAYAPSLRELLERFDQLVDRRRGTALVLTHGEPHPGNIVYAEGRVLLLDWDTLALAPPERDLWMLDTPGELERYAERSGRPVDRVGIELYRLRWKLDDVASFVQLLRSAHTDNADTARMWAWAVGSLESDAPTPYG